MPNWLPYNAGAGLENTQKTFLIFSDLVLKQLRLQKEAHRPFTLTERVRSLALSLWGVVGCIL